ncbi:hypothetical protein ARMGADRAFT_1070204 [Armillaria gallica]|uniref:Uncharacterized protein n=1 Tax=Armillaria gallica TaxID=47427 RepID=A0A2H3E8D7_ARMGA|nr:hypothetical protein ARMGADRAFT_1070204 [Armillaria gallica]
MTPANSFIVSPSSRQDSQKDRNCDNGPKSPYLSGDEVKCLRDDGATLFTGQDHGHIIDPQAQVPKEKCPFVRAICAGHHMRRVTFTQDMQPFFDAPEYPDFRIYATGNTLREIKLYVAYEPDSLLPAYVYDLSAEDIELPVHRNFLNSSGSSALGFTTRDAPYISKGTTSAKSNNADIETQDHGHKIGHPQEQVPKEGTSIKAIDDGLEEGAVLCFLCKETVLRRMGDHISQKHRLETRDKRFCPRCNEEFPGRNYTRHFMRHCEPVVPSSLKCQFPLCDYTAPVGRKDLLKRHTNSCGKLQQ